MYLCMIDKKEEKERDAKSYGSDDRDKDRKTERQKTDETIKMKETVKAMSDWQYNFIIRVAEYENKNGSSGGN